MPDARVLALASEARGEFLLVERMRPLLAERGWQTVHVTALAADAPEITAGTADAIAVDAHPAFARAHALDGAGLVAAVREREERLGVNLRRLWQADWRWWRQGYHHDQMARLAVAHVDVWSEVVERHRPVAGWGEDGGHLVKRILYTLGPAAGFTCWFLTLLPLDDRLLAVSNPLNRLDPAAFARLEPTEDERAAARALLDDVRASKLQFARPRDMRLRPERVANFARLLARRYVTRPPGAATLHPLTFARGYAQQRGASAVLRPFYKGIGDMPFVFHPVHYVHDVQITVRARQWEDQLALLEHVASSLPYGYELAIKEHPFDPGGPALARLVGLLRRRPEIRLLDPSIHAHEVLRRCAAVTTINSTVGFEALYFRKPVVTFSHSPYRGLGLTFDVGDPYETADVLREALLGDGPSDEELIRYVAFLGRHSFPGTSLAWDDGDVNVRRYVDALDELASVAEWPRPDCDAA